MSDEGQGFRVHDKFYPAVSLSDWRNGDFVLARKVTGVAIDEIVGIRADIPLANQAFVAVAIAQAQPELEHDQIVAYVHKLKPSDMEQVGFTPDEEEHPTDRGEAPESSSSSTSEPPSESPQAKSRPDDSGDQD